MCWQGIYRGGGRTLPENMDLHPLGCKCDRHERLVELRKRADEISEEITLAILLGRDEDVRDLRGKLNQVCDERLALIHGKPGGT